MSANDLIPLFSLSNRLPMWGRENGVRVCVYPSIPLPAFVFGEEICEDARIPDAPGVYFLWKFSKVLYVGQSVNMRKRHAGGHMHAKPGLGISWIELPGRDLLFAEAFYIGVCRPELNLVGNRRAAEECTARQERVAEERRRIEKAIRRREIIAARDAARV